MMRVRLDSDVGLGIIHVGVGICGMVSVEKKPMQVGVCHARGVLTGILVFSQSHLRKDYET